MKKYFKKLIALLWPKSNKKQNYLPVLCYHSVTDYESDLIDSIKIKKFEEQLNYIKQNFECILFSEINQSIFNEENEKPYICITFDDGYKDNYDNALPLLKKYGLKATFFITTNYISKVINLVNSNKWTSMSWDNVKFIDSHENFEIGIHTKNHFILSEISEKMIEEEISESKYTIENYLNKKVEIFAYPFGNGCHIKKIVLDILNKLNIKLACTTYQHSNHYKYNNLLINRIIINSDDDINSYIFKIIGKYNYMFYYLKIKSILKYYQNNKKTII